MREQIAKGRSLNASSVSLSTAVVDAALNVLSARPAMLLHPALQEGTIVAVGTMLMLATYLLAMVVMAMAMRSL